MTIDPDDLRFLHQMTRDVVEASRVRRGQRIGTSSANTTAQTLIRPGGWDCYPAMWVRDFSMSLDCGLITAEEAHDHLKLIASRQNGAATRKLRSGAIVPPHAIPDHINFDASAVFYPGTMSAGEDQGGEPFGILPPADDHYEFVHIAYRLWQMTGDARFLDEPVEGMTIGQRLGRAFAVPRTDDSTGGMFTTSASDRAVGFGFCDTVYLTGSILFPSLLRYRAARELARMSHQTGREIVPGAPEIATTMASHFGKVFMDPSGSGWLLAATEVGRRPDVWGTLYALTLGVLSGDEARAARDAVIHALSAGTITFQGAVRHIPTDHDASSSSAWDRVASGVAINTYQNGAYWHTPTGWLIAAIAKYEPVMAGRMFGAYLSHLREQDFRKGRPFGAPWECIGPGGKANQNPLYMASVTVPLGVVQQL
jgi:hypothetical protein